MSIENQKHPKCVLGLAGCKHLYLLTLHSSNRITGCTAASSFWSSHSGGGCLYHGDLFGFLSRAFPLSIDNPPYTHLALPFFAGVLFEKIDAND